MLPKARRAEIPQGEGAHVEEAFFCLFHQCAHTRMPNRMGVVDSGCKIPLGGGFCSKTTVTSSITAPLCALEGRALRTWQSTGHTAGI